MKFSSRRSSRTRAPGSRHPARQSDSSETLPASSSPAMDTVWIPSLMETSRRRVEFMHDNVVIGEPGCDTGLYENGGAVNHTDCGSATAYYPAHNADARHDSAVQRGSVAPARARGRARGRERGAVHP